jgi:hypothetical protein
MSTSRTVIYFLRICIPLFLDSSAFALPTCTDFGSNPAYGLARNPAITRLAVSVVPIGGSVFDSRFYVPPGGATRVARPPLPATVPYCQIEFTFNSGEAGPRYGYNTGQSEAIGIRIGLPLRADDGGRGQGWNGKIHNIGSGGCMGYLLPLTEVTNTGYAGAASDGGHTGSNTGFDCGFGVNQSSHTLNVGLLKDFSLDHVIWQTRWPKILAKTYYGKGPDRTYWTGCSQGGREGHIAAQAIPEEYDGILAGGSGLYWMRFHVAQAWPGVVIKGMLKTKGKTLSEGQIATATRLAIAACDAQDGVADGVLGDPRICRWTAKNAVCGAPGAPEHDCLDVDQAEAYDTIRRGPRNSRGELIWFPWEQDTTFSNVTNHLGASDEAMKWALADTTFRSEDHLYMDQAHLRAAADPLGITYEDLATLASQRVGDLVDAANPQLGWAKASGVRLISWTGTADRNIHPRNSIDYYRRVAEYFGTKVDDPALQSWFRLFLYPGVAHCGSGLGPQPGDSHNGPLFQALVNWVENGVPPDQIIATKYAGSTGVASGAQGPVPNHLTGKVAATRPVCPYPKAAVYNGSGSVNDAKNFTCGGDVETPEIVRQDRTVRHKFENGTGLVGPPYGRDGQVGWGK